MREAAALAELFREFDADRAVSFLRRSDLSTAQVLKHPLGFAYTVLRREDQYALRLHIWPDRVRYEQHPFWPIHNHKFDLLSVVLAGSLTNRSYQIRDAGENPTFRLYRVMYEIEGSVMSATERTVDLELAAIERISAHGKYSVAAGTFHQTIVSTGTFTATLALTRDSPADLDIRTIGDIRGQQRYKYARSEILGAERDALISELESTL
jgi:hypothetical protein